MKKSSRLEIRNDELPRKLRILDSGISQRTGNNLCADASTGVWRLHHDASTIPSHQEIGCHGRTTAARPQKLRTCHATPPHPLSLLSASLACCKCTARSEMGKVVLRTKANQRPVRPHSPMSAMFGLWRIVVTVMEWSRLRWMPLNFKHTRSPSLPPFPHRLSAIALFLLPSPSS